MGQQCLGYEPQTGQPQKLHKASKSDLCEFCQRARLEGAATVDEHKKDGWLPRDEVELESYKRALDIDDLIVLKSRAVEERNRLEENLLVEHCSRQGDFWQAVRGLRERWNISPTIGIPPERPVLNNPLPESTEMPEEELTKLLRAWIEDLSSVSRRFFPKRQELPINGNNFVTCCAFYDPPRDDLFSFFEACATPPSVRLPRGWEDRKDEPLVAMSGLPVEKLPNPWRVAGAWRIYYQGLIRELGDRYLKPLGLDVEELVQEVLDNKPSLSKNLDVRLQLANDEASDYVRVDEDMTRDDILNAAQFITQPSEPRKGGAPPRRRLTAVQYAILKDEYGLTFRQIAEQYEGQTDGKFLRQLEAHVKFGREILGKR